MDWNLHVYTIARHPRLRLLPVFGFLAAGCMLALSGCASRQLIEGQKKCLEDCGQPAWNENIGKYNNKKVKAFGGISKLYSMEQRARSDAETDAIKRALDELGVYGERKFKEVVTHSGISSDVIDPAVVADEITRMKSEGTALGNFARYHTQTWEENRAGKPVSLYKVYALYEVDRTKSAELLRQTMQNQLEELRRKNIEYDSERAKKLLDELSDDW